MKSKKKIRNESLIFIVTLLGIVIFVNLLSVRFFARGDLTENRLFTLSNASVSLVRNLRIRSSSKPTSRKTCRADTPPSNGT